MDGARISSDALSAFATFADHLNLTRAAAVLRISQPALHAKLATLARQVGRPLYNRVGRRLVLTPDGEAVARFARDHDDRLGRFLEELRVTPTSRPIVVAAGHAAYMHVLADVIRTTLAERPGSLRLLHTHRHQMLAAVRTGRAHLGFSALDVLPDDLVITPVATYPQVLLAPEGHRLAGRHTVTLADLAGEEFVVPPPSRPFRVNFERSMRAAGVASPGDKKPGVPWTVAVEAEGWPLTIHFVTLGVGVTIVSGCVVPAPGLVTVPVTDLPVVTYYAAHRTTMLDDPRVADLLDAIRASVRP